MKEHPILFSGDMVRAILDGRKTMTRRVCKLDLAVVAPTGKIAHSELAMRAIMRKCPYGQPGDRLWVREAFCPDWCDHVIYKADGGSAIEAGYTREPRWKPSIHMPRWTSRITLEITAVRVERLQDITELDSGREGDPKQGLIASENTHIDWFKNLWDSLNSGRGYGWDVNPWVWVIEFKRIISCD